MALNHYMKVLNNYYYCKGRPNILYNEAMNTSLEKKEFKPELVSRRSELIAWGSAVVVNGAWLLLIVFNQSMSFWLPILGIPLLLIAIGISLGNWMDRKTIIKQDEKGIYFSNGLRHADLGWDEIKEVRILPAQWGEKVQVFGGEVYFAFHTLGEVKSNGRVLGRTGFKDGDRILKHILDESGLSESQQVDLGDQQEGYYYSRQ
jgi:uncharacterized membrane protein